MNRWRWALLIVTIILLSILAFFLRDVVYQMVVLPLAYLWWLLGFYYSLVPQLLSWTLLLVGVFVIVLSNLIPGTRPNHRKTLKRRAAQGQVEALAIGLERVNKGNYFKWQIANRLGRIARGLNEISGGQAQLEVRNESVKKYLEAGLNTSFVDYPRPSNPLQHPAPSILDMNPEKAVDYLESLMENHRD